jgi:hypothetical protein
MRGMRGAAHTLKLNSLCDPLNFNALRGVFFRPVFGVGVGVGSGNWGSAAAGDPPVVVGYVFLPARPQGRRLARKGRPEGRLRFGGIPFSAEAPGKPFIVG